MDFSEVGSTWRSVPSWASFLIEFGFAWPAQPGASRRIAIVSMPCDSAAAGLIVLGAMRRCLELDDANDVGSHYQRLLELAHKRPNGVSLRHATLPGCFVFDGFDPNRNPMVKQPRSKSSRRINIPRASAMDWRINGEAPVAVRNGQQVPNSQFYAHLVKQGGNIRPSNLSESHSQICLAGRGVGAAPTRGCMADIRFRVDGCEANLSQLLTVQRWMPGTISRVNFYNARTEEFDRQAGRPQVVIADGDASFLRVVDGKGFEHSDVVGVIHRTMERDRLEAVGTKVRSLRQWYDRDGAILNGLPERPRGIGIAVLRRSQPCQ